MQLQFNKAVLSANTPGQIDDIVYSIVQDEKYGYLWVVTFKGLQVYRKLPNGKLMLVDTSDMIETGDLNLFHEITKDRKGNLWLGSIGNGLYMLDYKRSDVINYNLQNIKSVINKSSFNVALLSATNTNKVNLSVSRVGFFRLDLNTGLVHPAKDNALKNIRSISSMMHFAERDELWVTEEGRDNVYIFKNASSEPRFYQKFSLKNLENNITALYKDDRNNVWIGTSNGLYKKSDGKQAVLISDKCRFVNAISEDKNKNILVGTEKEGLYVVKPQQEKNTYVILNLRLKVRDYQSFSVQSICISRNGDVYVGTKEGCIYFIDNNTRQIFEISGKFGITDNGFVNIIEDNSGFLWISTIKKIIRFNTTTHVATYFSEVDGMKVKSFYKDAVAKTNSGIILFGGNNGVSAFNPANLAVKSRVNKQVTITDILVQNKSIFDDENKRHYSFKNNAIELEYSENNIGIEFSDLEYTSASKVQYAYRLQGVNGC